MRRAEVLRDESNRIFTNALGLDSLSACEKRIASPCVSFPLLAVVRRPMRGRSSPLDLIRILHGQLGLSEPTGTCRACGAVRQVMVPFADPRREVPPPSVVERRHLGESCGLAIGDPIADPGLRASQESWTHQTYTGHRDRSSAFRLHSSGGCAVIATERPGRRDRPDRSASHRQNPDDSEMTT